MRMRLDMAARSGAYLSLGTFTGTDYLSDGDGTGEAK